MSVIDHLVYAVPELERGVDEIERRLGVRPARGGRHPELGTHNALLSLGPSTYLEIVAPEPRPVPPARGVVFGLDGIRAPLIVTWVLRREDLDGAVAKAAAAGLELGVVQSGRRAAPDGSVLTWRLTDPYAMPLDGAVPFLIAWGDTPHPAAAAPPAGELIGLRIAHPEPGRLRTALATLDARADVTRGDAVRIVATLRTPAGELELG